MRVRAKKYFIGVILVSFGMGMLFAWCVPFCVPFLSVGCVALGSFYICQSSCGTKRK